ncbi:hypothetical protein ACFPN7_28660 [Amycolatopsis halotolerans]|uniref:hypothetical protein n=1 Tax=Amycolatopsis halotolerans TaxID=330083 RepID=UPI00360D6554
MDAVRESATGSLASSRAGWPRGLPERSAQPGKTSGGRVRFTKPEAVLDGTFWAARPSARRAIAPA